MQTILFLHGWGGNGQSFAPVARYFSNFYNVLTPSMPVPETEVFTLCDYADSIQKFLRENNVTKCHIVAHSFGARIGALLAAHRPDLIDKLVVTGGAGLKAHFSLKTWVKIKLYKILKIGKGSPDYQKLNEIQKSTFRNVVNRDLSPEISKIKTPTLLLYGGKDKATPPYMAKKWTKLCKSARYKIYKNCGHFAYLENLEVFIKDVHEFIL
jgi:pimeloyl-ACP methyl ester carboxylesterase